MFGFGGFVCGFFFSFSCDVLFVDIIENWVYHRHGPVCEECNYNCHRSRFFCCLQIEHICCHWVSENLFRHKAQQELNKDGNMKHRMFKLIHELTDYNILKAKSICTQGMLICERNQMFQLKNIFLKKKRNSFKESVKEVLLSVYFNNLCFCSRRKVCFFPWYCMS